VLILSYVLTAAIFIRALLSWFPIDPRNPLVTILYDVTEPILEPLRRVVPRLGMIDITPLVAIILIQVIGNVAANALR
jgi:YggT family protein